MKSRKYSLINPHLSVQNFRSLGRSLSSIAVMKDEIPEIDKSSYSQLCGLDNYDAEEIEINVLTPNGLLLIMKVDKNLSLKEIKTKVFEIASTQPLYGALHDKSNYFFSCINFETTVQELLEDDSKLYEVKPFYQTMRLIKKQDDKEEKQLNAQIGILIGKGLHEFDALKSPEVNNYRFLALEFTQNFEQIRKHCSKAEYIHYNYPVRLERNPQIPIYLQRKLDAMDSKILIEFRLDTSKIFFTLKVNYNEKIQEVIAKCLKLVSNKCQNDKKDYVMKVSGFEEYLGLLDDYSLIQYTFIRESISSSRTPSFVLKLLNDIKLTNINDLKLDDSKTDKCFRERTMSSFFNQHNKALKPDCILDLEPELKLQLQLNNAIRVNCVDNTMIACVIGLFQGTKLLCPKSCSNAYIVKNGSVKFDELIDFDISLINLPRSCRFSVMLFEIVQQTNKKNSTLKFKTNNSLNSNSSSNTVTCTNGACYFNGSSNYPLYKRQLTGLPLNNLAASNHNLIVNPLCWINLTLFDYNARLRSETITLPMWNYSQLNSPISQSSNSAITLDDLLTDLCSFDDNQCLESESLLNPIGTVTWNPDKDTATCLTCTFLSYTTEPNASLLYPTMERIVSYYKSLHESKYSSRDEEDSLEQNFLEGLNRSTTKSNQSEDFSVKELEDLVQQMITTEDLSVEQNSLYGSDGGDLDKIRNCKTKNGYQLLTNTTLYSSTINLSANVNSNLTIKGRKASKAYLDQLKEICKKDPLNELDKKDKELIWYLKEFCKRKIPDCLPHLIASVKWNVFKDQVLDLLVLINDWPLLSAEKGLQLLDFKYSDLFVRRFAVNCIQQLTDDELNLYLLQLVQALKFESYMHNDLGEFLLHRALQNPIIGHQLFWLLRSEMSDSSVSIKFGLILEAYCRGANNHMKVLSKQLNSLNKFREINKFIRQEAFKRKENRYSLNLLMQNILQKTYYKDQLQEIINPLNPRLKLDKIKIEKCKFMDSKMKPLWLVFSNEDIGVEDTSIIYKSGDDLRQDMLICNMLRIMDKLWKDEGLDLRLSFYNVIATTSTNSGLIEVVPKANTIANIQKEKALAPVTSAFQKSSLLQWLRERNPDEDQMLNAIDEFTKSCAGYSVATYVLGIADRHSDNIMLKSNGQLLHIDFGHILGNFKLKWKIRRERVPFVFTNDFAYVITNGSTKKLENERFQRFLFYCDQAFLVLRRKGAFIISIFSMMMSSGLELLSDKDLSYLRETLVLNLTEQEALKHFRNKFNESMKNSWKTSFNFFFHNIAKDNN